MALLTALSTAPFMVPLIAVRALALAIPLLGAAVASGQCTPDWIREPDQQIPGVGSSTLATTSWDPDGPGPQAPWLIVGGTITAAGDTPVSAVAAWDGQRWIPMGATASSVYAFHTLNGQLLAFGTFRDPSGTLPAARWTGTDWAPLDTSLRGSAFTATTHAGEVCFAGSFQVGPDRRGIAAWNGSTLRTLPPIVNDPNQVSYCRAVASRGGELIASEERINLTTSERRYTIQAWNGVSWRAIGSLDNAIGSLHVSGSELLAGGSFTFVDGVPVRGGLARWDGFLWRPMPSEIDGVTRHITEGLGHLYIAGSYADANSTFQGVLEWDAGGWRTPGGVPALPGAGQGLGVHAGELVCVGSFPTAGDALASNVASFNGSRWRGYGQTGDAFNGTLFNIVAIGNDVYVGGSATMAGDASTISGLFQRRAGAAPAWSAVDPTLTGAARPIGSFNNELVVAGSPSAQGLRLTGIASWNGSTWRNFGTGLRVDFPVPDTFGYPDCAMQVGSELFVGGNFNRAGGVTSPAIAAWNGASWRSLGGGMSHTTPGILPRVSALASWRGMTVAAGSFTHAGGTLANGIAAWNGFAWLPLGPGAENARVGAIAVFNDRIIASGFFHIGNDYTTLASWDGTTWRVMDSINVTSMAVFDNQLILGGQFQYINDISNLARWPGSGEFRAMGAPNASANAMLAHQGSLYVGGQFSRIDGQNAFFFAEYGCPCAADFDGNGQADFFDYLEFAQAFSSDDPRADVDGNGQVDFFDYLEFAAAFDAGCD
jgi:hypothetical protein